MKKVLVTGATGFIGQALIKCLSNHDFEITATTRQDNASLTPNVRQIQVGDLLPSTDWSDALSGVNVVIHLAARVHIMNDDSGDPAAEFRKINTLGTLNLARQAAKLKVSRFIYLSSIKVNGETTIVDEPFNEQVSVVPTDPYGLSKYLAEQGLEEIANQTMMDVVIIRPPLVYGPNVKANFETMMKWLYKGIPLPLGTIHNQRSLVALDNLVDLIKTCIEHPNASNQIFLVSDDEDLSTTELLQRLAVSLGKSSHLVPVPAYLLTTVATLLGKRNFAQRLCGSLHIDISHTKQALGWSPPVSVTKALQDTANTYLKQLENKS